MRRKQRALAVMGVPKELTDAQYDVILEMARSRAELVGLMRDALEGGDETRALQLAKQIAGLEKEVVK